jgi:AcrR family transcriptional regulator
MSVKKVRSVSEDIKRQLRADARRNEQQLLTAARDLFIERGAQVPLEDIAAAAGVGIATLYRRFGDRRGLARAVALASLEQTHAAARSARISHEDPFAALAVYMHAVLDLRTSAVMPELLDQLAEDDPQRLELSAAINSIIEELINDARHEGVIRDELRFADIGLLLVRLSRPLIGLKAELQLPYAHRHLDLVLAGMRPGKLPLSGPRLTQQELRNARD